MLQELSRRWHAGHRGPALDPGRLPHYWGQRNLGVMPIRSFPPVRTPHATRTSNRVRSFHDLAHCNIQTLNAFLVEFVYDPVPYAELLPKPNEHPLKLGGFCPYCTGFRSIYVSAAGPHACTMIRIGAIQHLP